MLSDVFPLPPLAHVSHWPRQSHDFILPRTCFTCTRTRWRVDTLTRRGLHRQLLCAGQAMADRPSAPAPVPAPARRTGPPGPPHSLVAGSAPQRDDNSVHFGARSIQSGPSRDDFATLPGAAGASVAQSQQARGGHFPSDSHDQLSVGGVNEIARPASHPHSAPMDVDPPAESARAPGAIR